MRLNNTHRALGEQLLLCIKVDGDNALITYGDLCKRVGNIVTPLNSSEFLGDLSVLCYENNMPLISAIVVNKEQYIPGDGFFKLYSKLENIPVKNKDEIFKSELAKVRKFKGWKNLSELLGVDVQFTKKETDLKVELKLDTSNIYKEGKLILLQNHLKRGRDPQVIKDAKLSFIKKHGHLYCEICGFDFEKIYGKLGENVIDGHHINCVSDMSVDGDETHIEDIIMVCPNCHRIIHNNIEIELSVLKEMISARKNVMMKNE
jgi:hypothetical protein